jgi:DNA polymerase III subunit gamma/tau
MSHLAIARKWRPQRFEEIVGQTHITQTLQNAIRLGRVHHAYLFTGARGVGKTSAARILAKALNCANGPAENPCNECENCREITRGTHPDVMEIDGASHNRVDDIRDLIETVRYMPSKGKYRIYVIDEVHMVTTQAFNALLKTLEEPPEHVLFIFATTDPQKIPDTVLSRCLRYDFKMMPARTILGRLREICEGEGARIPDGVLGQIAREAAGSMRDGQSLLDQVLSFAEGEVTESQAAEILGLVDRTLLHELMRAVTRTRPSRSTAASSSSASTSAASPPTS